MLGQRCAGGKNYFAGKLGDIQNLASLGGKKNQRTHLVQVSNSVRGKKNLLKCWHGSYNFKMTEQEREREKEGSKRPVSTWVDSRLNGPLSSSESTAQKVESSQKEVRWR